MGICQLVLDPQKVRGLCWLASVVGVRHLPNSTTCGRSSWRSSPARGAFSELWQLTVTAMSPPRGCPLPTWPRTLAGVVYF